MSWAVLLQASLVRVCATVQAGRGGFTLIELLVVLSILAMLMTILMPIVTIAGRAARISATRSVMVKVDTAARLFRADLGSYPWQSRYEDLAVGEAWTNRLYYHLGTDIAPRDFSNLRADADAAAALYVYTNAPASTFTYGPADMVGASGSRIMMINRMAAERARLAIYSGHVEVTSPVLPVPYIDDVSLMTIVRRVMPTAPMLAAPASAAKPGWAKDYLAGEMEARYVSGEAIIDGWKRPLLYVGQVSEGMTSAPILQTMGNQTTSIRALEFGLQPAGRTTLGANDAATGKPLVADAAFLPDPGNLRHSDRRFYAAPGLEQEFELWSAGPDGRADWMRDAKVNDDNVPLMPYDKKIP